MPNTIRQIKFDVTRWSKEDHKTRGMKIARFITGVLFPTSNVHNFECERSILADCFYDDHTELWQLGGGNNWWMKLIGNEVTLTARYDMLAEALEGLGHYLKWQLNR